MSENDNKRPISSFNPLSFLKDFLDFFKTKGSKEGIVLDEHNFSETLTRMALIGSFDSIKTYAEGAKQIIATKGDPTFLTIYMNAILNTMAFSEKLLEKTDESIAKSSIPLPNKEPMETPQQTHSTSSEMMNDDEESNTVRIDEDAFDYILKTIKK